MSTAAVLIADYARVGIRLEAHGDRLRFKAGRSVTEVERRMLSEHKAAILVELTATDIRARLHQLADAARVPPAIVAALPDDDVAACEGFPDPWLTQWLRLRERMADPVHVAACPWCSRFGAR